MKVLLIHNYYQQPGGEDTVFRAEKDLLVAAGHRIVEFARGNDEIVFDTFFSRAKLGFGMLSASQSVRTVRSILRRETPDVVHFHNTFPLVSPGAYYVCREAGVPVIQTLHNYRLLCPSASLYREGKVCEECMNHSLLRGVRHGCYRDSHGATAAVALMLAFHRLRGTWIKMVDRYIAPTEFVRKKFLRAGLPAAKVSVKPHFLYPDPGMRTGRRDYVLFVGRLSPGKGLRTLLDAWKLLRITIPLRIVGDGPLRSELEAERDRAGLSSVCFDGWLPREQVHAAMQRAEFLISPSESYETFGLTIVEAFACGTPVIASRLGAMAEIVESGRTGVHFTAGNAQDLRVKVERAWNRQEETLEMGRECRKEYVTKYTAERNYPALIEIYRSAIQERCAQDRSSSRLTTILDGKIKDEDNVGFPATPRHTS